MSRLAGGIAVLACLFMTACPSMPDSHLIAAYEAENDAISKLTDLIDEESDMLKELAAFQDDRRVRAVFKAHSSEWGRKIDELDKAQKEMEAVK